MLEDTLEEKTAPSRAEESCGGRGEGRTQSCAPGAAAPTTSQLPACIQRGIDRLISVTTLGASPSQMPRCRQSTLKSVCIQCGVTQLGSYPRWSGSGNRTLLPLDHKLGNPILISHDEVPGQDHGQEPGQDHGQESR